MLLTNPRSMEQGQQTYTSILSKISPDSTPRGSGLRRLHAVGVGETTVEGCRPAEGPGNR
jgi:hypothetical protein